MMSHEWSQGSLQASISTSRGRVVPRGSLPTMLLPRDGPLLDPDHVHSEATRLSHGNSIVSSSEGRNSGEASREEVVGSSGGGTAR